MNKKFLKKNKTIIIVGIILLFLILAGSGLRPMSIVGGDEVFVNQPYTATINLVSPTDIVNDYTSGQVRELYAGTAVISSSGSYVFQSTQEKLSSKNYSYNLTWTPTTTGKFAVISFIVKSESTYNYNTKTWSAWTAPEIVVQDTKEVNVIQIDAPPTNPIGNIFTNILNSIWSFITGLFNW
jgi:hypothetical protein